MRSRWLRFKRRSPHGASDQHVVPTADHLLSGAGERCLSWGSQFSIAIGAFGVGGLLGAVGLLGVDPTHDRRCLSSWSAAGYGVIVLLCALNPWFWGLPALLVLAGISMSLGNTSANAFLHRPTTAAWPSRQPVHARHSRRPVNRGPADWHVRQRSRRAPRSVDQRHHCDGRANDRRTQMDGLRLSKASI
jgi:hypothetical protein